MRNALKNMHASRRFVALTIAYVLALQAFFSGGAQLRVALAETPGICTLFGFQQPDKPAHGTGICAKHCVAHASLDAAAFFAAVATIVAIALWPLGHAWPDRAPVRPVTGFRGRAPPRS